MSKKAHYSCGLDAVLALIGGKWKPLIIFHLGGGRRRFSELKRLVEGVSEKVLIQQLRDLTDDGVIARHDYREVPPRVDYELTAFGLSLAGALRPLCAWGEENSDAIVTLFSEGGPREPALAVADSR